MSQSKLTKSVLEKIQHEHIKPRPRWMFWIRNSAFWFVFSAAVILGSRAVAVVLYILLEMDWEFIARAPGPVYVPLAKIFPLFWLLFFGSFVVFAVFGLHHTKTGYRLPFQKVLALNLGVTLGLGLLLFAIDDGPRFERFMNDRVPLIESFEDRRERAWSDPDDGRLAGMIVQIHGPDVLMLDDLTGKRWEVDLSRTQIWGPELELVVQMRVRVVGQQTDDDHFMAEVIGPWLRPMKKDRLFRERNALRLRSNE